MDSKVLVLDVETAPKTVHVWGLWQQNVGLNQIIEDMYILNWSAKWLEDGYIYSDSLHYYPDWKKDPSDDRRILESVWELIDEADAVITHNGDRFDIPTLKSRFVLHGMKPPSPFVSIDTLKIARREFKFTSNKLDFISQALGVGEKMDTGGFELWSDIVLRQDRKAFDKMVAYCEHDVELLEEVYLKLRSWDHTHPALHLPEDPDTKKCNACASENVYKNGVRATKTLTYQRYRCKDCGHHMRSRKKMRQENGNLILVST